MGVVRSPPGGDATIESAWSRSPCSVVCIIMSTIGLRDSDSFFVPHRRLRAVLVGFRRVLQRDANPPHAEAGDAGAPPTAAAPRTGRSASRPRRYPPPLRAGGRLTRSSLVAARDGAGGEALLHGPSAHRESPQPGGGLGVGRASARRRWRCSTLQPGAHGQARDSSAVGEVPPPTGPGVVAGDPEAWSGGRPAFLQHPLLADHPC